METEERRASASRETRETRVVAEVAIDGTGVRDVHTGVGFLDHMLDQFASHGLFDLTVQAEGDLGIDEHHTVEDVAIVLGRAFNQALGERRGIVRMASIAVPMDEALAQVAVDVSGRGYAVTNLEFSQQWIGDISSSLISHFIQSFASESRITIHASILAGSNDHHRAEALFKALGRALDEATRIDMRRLEQVPSTKGTISA
ncbi:MAG: imidazoleglycerol-phosphate dehydratase HisB [Chloroflexota bacterium]